MSIVKVAKAAGVSPATVSRVINNGANVSPEKVQRIREAMEKLGYVPRARRPGPKPRSRMGIRTGNVLFLSIPGLEPAHLMELPALPQLLQGIQQELAANGMKLMLDLLPAGGEVPGTLSAEQVDGVLVLGHQAPMDARVVAKLRELPTVWVLREHPELRWEFDAVLYDNRRVGELAAEYLGRHGHRQVAFLNIDREHVAFAERGKVFLESWQKRTGQKPVVLEASSKEARAASLRVEGLVEQMLAMPQAIRPTGCFVASDDQMLGVVYALRARGLVPGKDIQLIGCNNDRHFMAQMHPRPATIDIQLEAIGRRAVAQLLWRLRFAAAPERARTFLSPVLIEADPSTEKT